MVLQRSQKKEKITVSNKEACPNAFKERGFSWNRHFILENKTKNHNYIKNIVQTIHVEANEGKSQFLVSIGGS